MAETAAKRIRPDGKQGKPDGRHDSRRNNGRYKFPPPCRAKAEDPLQNSSHKDRAENSAVTVFQSEYTENSISMLVNKLIDGQVAEGFFKECPITFRDIAVAKQVAIERLKSIYHTRIQYPELKKKNEVGEEADDRQIMRE